MSVEILNFSKQGNKTSHLHSDEAHWARRKAAIRAKRESSLQYTLHRPRRRRHTLNETATHVTATPAADDATRPEATRSDAARHDATRRPPAAPSRVSAEWSGATGGPLTQVVLRLHPAPSATPQLNVSSLANAAGGSGVVVRAEEALIVAFVLLLWVAAIALFFNRWGKIRCVYKLMLEPYQPKFQQQHRQSCALVESSVTVPPHTRKFSIQHRASLSRGYMSYDCGASFAAYQPCGYVAHRPRQNSVFVGSVCGMALIPESPPRRSRSAADLPALVTPGDRSAQPTPRASRAASLHSAVDLRVCQPSPRTSRAASLHSAVDMPPGSVQVHVRGSANNLNRPRSPRRLTITNV
ncbi:uncharacterized protein LOC119693046 isoform X3 [Plutella xylostella]|uniref:uncharacterized protein LOC119693046 isoform X3 n=1 Tax=Plutella xylostella TaxID=51655 RepID=UPI002032B540|nr:uncharacterized protein LOC119693046 isoform X3 [Plutella xylostella]